MDALISYIDKAMDIKTYRKLIKSGSVYGVQLYLVAVLRLHNTDYSELLQLHIFSWEHTWTRTGLHRIALHQIASACQCGQLKRPEAYTPNILMHSADPIWLMSVHQNEHYFVRGQCGQLFCRFCCFGGKQAYFMSPWIKFYTFLRISDQQRTCLMRTHSQ